MPDLTDECKRRFDLLRWDLQDVHRDLERLRDVAKATHQLTRDIQMELDELVRFRATEGSL